MIRRAYFFFLLFFAIDQSICAQQSVRLTNQWEFLRQDLGGIWEAVRTVGKGAPESVPLWEQVRLPHCVNATDAVDPDQNYYQGPAWYRTQLIMENPYSNGRTLLHFEGSGQKTEVYIYTTLVATHVGGYDEFTVDITDAVAAFKKNTVFQQQFKGKIPLSIRTDNSRDLEMIPSDLSDFNIYGGIYRYLNLVYVPALSIDQLFADASVDKAGKLGTLGLRCRFRQFSSSPQTLVSTKILDPSGKLVQQHSGMVQVQPDATIASFSIKNPLRWSPTSPQLYTVIVTVGSGADTYTMEEKIGFRHVEFIEKGPFMLNGTRLLLRGTHRHEDHAGVAAAMTEEMMREEMILMKEMGVNFIRLGHYQQSRIILQLCDSLGMVVWEEIPWCRGGLGGDTYKEQARRMLTNMIEQHYNHPSVILWGLGNENDWPGDFPEFDQGKIRAFMQELHELSHRLDPSRKTAIRRCDFCKDIVDVYSPSIWAGWYRGIYTEYKSISEMEMQKVKHFLHVEWGGDSHAGRHSENPDNALKKILPLGKADERAGDASLYGGAARVSKDGDWSESYICNLVDWHLKEQENMPWLTGSAQWPFKDFSTPVRPDNPVPYMNQKGVTERDLTKKESYYVFQSYWTDKPMVHIYGHTWPVRWGGATEEKMIKVYSNCDEAELWLNGKSLGVRKRIAADFPAAGLRWNSVFIAGNNQLKVIAKKGKQTVEDTLSFYYETRTWGKPANVLLEKIAENKDEVKVQVKLMDANNVQCLDSASWVHFGLTGEGRLIDNRGTSGGSRVVQLYNGRAVITARKNNGRSVISAKIDGLPAAFVEID